MPELHLPWLELSILVPLVGAIVVGFTARPRTCSQVVHR